jgi:hypothetical protein
MKPYVTFTDRSTKLGNLFVAAGNSEICNKKTSYTTDQKVFVIKTFQSSDVSCAAVGRQYLRGCCTIVTPPTMLLNSLKKQELCVCVCVCECVIKVWRNANVGNLFDRRSCWCSRGNYNNKSNRKCAKLSTTCWGLSQHRMENLSWSLAVSIQNAADSAIVGRQNSETLRFCEGTRTATGGQSGCLECHVVLRWSTLPLGRLH